MSVLVLLLISYVVFQLYEMKREEKAPYITVEQLKHDLANNNSSNEKLMP